MKNTDQSKKFGTFLQELREEAKVSVHKVSVQLGVLPEEISKWEQGEKIPSVENLKGLAHIYEINEVELRDVFDDHLESLGANPR